MFIETIKVDSLANNSYVVGSESSGRCAVIDPVRDIDQYTAVASRHGVRIAYRRGRLRRVVKTQSSSPQNTTETKHRGGWCYVVLRTTTISRAPCGGRLDGVTDYYEPRGEFHLAPAPPL